MYNKLNTIFMLTYYEFAVFDIIKTIYNCRSTLVTQSLMSQIQLYAYMKTLSRLEDVYICHNVYVCNPSVR